MKTFALSLLMAAAAVQPSAATPVDAAHAAESLLESYMAAWARSDANTIGSYYAADGDFISPDGLLAVGPSEVGAFYASAFKRGYAGSRGTFKPVKIRLTNRGTIAIDGEWAISGARRPDGVDMPPEAGIATAILVNTKGHWRISLLREQAGVRNIRPLAH
jgi:uncharacterized protein (TIGR02246 family)